MKKLFQIVALVLPVAVVAPVYSAGGADVAPEKSPKRQTARKAAVADEVKPGTQLQERRKRSAIKQRAEEKRKTLVNGQHGP